MIIGIRPLTAAEQAGLVGYPIATVAPAPVVQTESDMRALGERLARYGRRRRAAERGEDWTAVQ